MRTRGLRTWGLAFDSCDFALSYCPAVGDSGCDIVGIMAVLTDTFQDVITVNEVGVWRVAGSRVSVDSVLYAFNSGASPEEIVWQYDTLDLKQVYALITYYLHNPERVDKYLAESEKETERIRRRIKKEFPLPTGFKERIKRPC